MAEKVVQWKRMWQLCSGNHYDTPCKTVQDKLMEVSDKLMCGLHQYDKGSTDSMKKLEKLLKCEKNEKCLGFANSLQQLLGIDAIQAWSILRYYLVNEYRGSVNALSFIFSDTNKMQTDDVHHRLYDQMLEEIWAHYSLERMIVLKILKNVIEYHDRKAHPYWNEYDFVLGKLGIGKLRKSLLEQFETLVKEECPSKYGEFANREKKIVSWTERRAREIVEILQILILIIAEDGIETKELQKFIYLCKYHSFGREHEFLDPNNDMHGDLKRKMCFNEIGVFLIAMNYAGMKESWCSDVSRLIQGDVMTLHQNEEHGPILLAWMLMNLKHNFANEELSGKLRQFGVRAIQLNVFECLFNVVRHRMFSDLKSRPSIIIRQSIYNHLGHLCELIDAGTIGGYIRVYDLLGELLKTPQIGAVFIKNDDSSVHSLYLSAKEHFPADFMPLSLIASGLLQSGHDQHVFMRQELEELSIFTTVLDGRENIYLRPVESMEIDAQYSLTHDYHPLINVDFIIPTGTNCIITSQKNGQKLVHFDIRSNYFDLVSHAINELIAGAVHNSEIRDSQLAAVEVGFDVIVHILKKFTNPSEITMEMIAPIENVLEVINKFRILQPPPINLLAKCLDVCAQLLPICENRQTHRNEILERLLNLNIIPWIKTDNLDYKQLAVGADFESGLVGQYLINYERNSGRYNFLLAYFNFLNIAINKLPVDGENVGRSKLAIELPGLVFLLREIFPNVRSWRFENEKDRELIYIKTMDYFFNILQYNQTDSKFCVLINQTCIYSLLHFDYGMILLKFIGIGNSYLTSVIENETNWMSISTAGLNVIVQLSMNILMFLLKFKTRVQETPALLPLESVIYMPSRNHDSFHIIPVITSYMSNIFNRSLPVLSCRLLRRFAIEFNSFQIGIKKSLLTCLDMEHDQIRLTFLQRLNDDLETDNLKIAVLEFVEACIENDQAGVTAAIFKIANEKGGADKNTIDGILTYMEEYLDAIAKDPTAVASPLLSRIMSIFHALWIINRTPLIQGLIDKPSFWPSLCKPLFNDYNSSIKVYAQLFNILGLEIYKVSEERKINEELRKIFEKFFSEATFEKWLENIFDFPKLTQPQFVDEIPVWLGRLQSFKDLMVIMLRKRNHPIKISERNLKSLTQKCLSTLIAYNTADNNFDYRPFIIISELLLIVVVEIKYFDAADVRGSIEMLQQINDLIGFLFISYQSIHQRARDSILAICIRIFQTMPIKANLIIEESLSIVTSVVNIIVLEIEKNIEKDHDSIRLALNLLKKLILHFESENITGWETRITHTKLINRIIFTLSQIAQNFEQKAITAELLDLLIILSKTQCSIDMIHADIEVYLWLKLLPPPELIAKSPTTKWHPQEWWPIYWRSVELVTTLIATHQHLFIKEALLFVGVHEEYLADTLLLAKQTLEPSAMMLMKRTMEFVCEMVKFEKIWRIDHGPSLFKLMRCMQVVMDHAVSLLDRPNILKRLVDGIKTSTTTQLDLMEQQNQALPSNELILAMNELIECIILATRSLMAFSPNLLSLIADTEFAPSQWHPLIEIHFGAPKLNAQPFPALTFGTLLSGSCLFVKALSMQHYTFSENFLNKIPAADIDTPSADTSQNTSNAHQNSTLSTSPKRSTARSYSKSFSLTGSTANHSTNEYLANLDPQLCCRALEYIMTLLASQSLLLLKDPKLSGREKQLIRRDMFPELSVFYDFVRKNILAESRDQLLRKKYGCIPMKMRTNYDEDDDDDDEDDENSGSYSSAKSRLHQSRNSLHSMRVSVMRKLHLKQQTPKTPESSNRVAQKRSMMVINESPPELVTSTPEGSPSLTRTASMKRVMFDLGTEPRRRSSSSQPTRQTAEDLSDDEDEEIEYFDDSEDMKYANQSFVQLVEKDYFHILWVIFSTLQTDD